MALIPLLKIVGLLLKLKNEKQKFDDLLFKLMLFLSSKVVVL